jgi:hypothetical protein
LVVVTIWHYFVSPYSFLLVGIFCLCAKTQTAARHVSRRLPPNARRPRTFNFPRLCLCLKFDLKRKLNLYVCVQKYSSKFQVSDFKFLFEIEILEFWNLELGTWNLELGTVYKELFDWCAGRDFAGYDPFDGLNSRFFQATPLKNLALARLGYLQTVKRAPVNLRPFLSVLAGTNSKGIALFALAELSRFRATKKHDHEKNAKSLLEKLQNLKIKNQKSKIKNRIAFGYNFDWQSRAFFAPRGTPTIVPTAFAARAFIEAYEIFQDEIYIETARQIGEFIVHDLNRSFESTDEICFSYTPLDRSVIFNASLLAGETLASVGAIDNNQEWLELAAKTVRFVTRRQLENGAWAYGTKLRHKWVDNFHTAFILLSLKRLQDLIPSLQSETAEVIKRGYDFWITNLFLADGTPKYYDKKTYPVDIHSAAAAIVALCELKTDENAVELAEKVTAWTVANMRDSTGFFYYQKLRFYTVKTPFIRWGQAWMLYALGRLLEEFQRRDAETQS